MNLKTKPCKLFKMKHKKNKRKNIEQSITELMDNFKYLRYVKLESQKGVGEKNF